MALAGAMGCQNAAPSEPAGERAGEAQSALLGGTPDTTGLAHNALYPAVVGINYDGGRWATGVALSDRVVATAGHVIGSITRGCEGFSYDQLTKSKYVVKLADAFGQTNQPDDSLYYNVDAVIGRQQYAPLNAYDCCKGKGADPGCFACAQADSGPPAAANFLAFFDIALMHLERPLPNYVKPMRFVAHIAKGNEAADPANAKYKIDPSTWLGATAMVVGVGQTQLGVWDPGLRRYGPTTISELGELWNGTGAGLLDKNTCDAAVLLKLGAHCDACMLHVSSSVSPPSLPDGGAAQLKGDSGGPLIVNDTAHGGTPIPGLPNDPDHPGEGEPFVVGIFSHFTASLVDDFSVATWNATATLDVSKPGSVTSTDMGDFIVSHLRDWDQDGVWDKDGDNCSLTRNLDQANSNGEVEAKKGFDAVGDACDPIPCANTAPAAATYHQVWGVDSGFFHQGCGTQEQATLDIEPMGSHYASSGAMNHIALPEVSVGSVPTSYRFCQPNADGKASVVCTDPTVYDNALLLKPEPTGPAQDNPWMRVEMKAGNSPVTQPEPLPYPPLAASLPISRTWRYQHDFAKWASSKEIELPAGCSANGCPQPHGGWSTTLDGRFWIRSDTTAATVANGPTKPADPVSSPPSTLTRPEWPPTTGFRTKVPLGPGSGDDVLLSNTYIALAPDRYECWSTSMPIGPYYYFKYIFNWLLPDPAPQTLPGYDGTWKQATFLMPLPDGHVGLLLGDGSALLADSLVAPGLRAALLDASIHWVEPAEPRLNIASSRFRPGVQVVGLAANGTAVTELVLRSGQVLGTAAEIGAGACLAPPSGILAWWPLDGSGADIAGVSSPHDGVVHGGVAFTDGVAGQAALLPWVEDVGPNGALLRVDNFDGTFNLANDFTVEGWVNPASTAHASGETIVGRGVISGWSIGIAPDGTLQATKQGVGVLSTPIAVVPGRWQHVAVSFSQTGTVFYLDGQAVYADTSLSGAADVPYSPTSAGEPVVLGAQSYSGTAPVLTSYFDGSLDEIAIYSRVLSATEIAAIVAAGGAGKCKPVGPSPFAAQAMAQPAAGPSPRDHYTAVFTRAENALFVLGGTDLATDERLHDVWMQRVDPPGSWVSIQPTGYVPEKIIDATWSYYDHRLWVLDERQGKPKDGDLGKGKGKGDDKGKGHEEGKPSVRLVRIDPYSGATSMVGEWPRRPNAKDQWLVVDRDGPVLLVSSTQPKKKFTVMRFTATPFDDTAPIGISLTVRPGRLAFRPLADTYGYSFVLKVPGGLKVDRVTELPPAAAQLGDDEDELE